MCWTLPARDGDGKVPPIFSPVLAVGKGVSCPLVPIGFYVPNYGRGSMGDDTRMRGINPQVRGGGLPGFRACPGPPWRGARAGGRRGMGPMERRPAAWRGG